MALLNIVTYGEPILKQKAKQITGFNEEIKNLAENMIETMHASEGIGLAAPQVGESISLMVLNGESLFGEGHEDLAVINPVISNTSGEEILEEGCLSFPELRFEVKRFSELDLEYRDVRGKKEKIHAQDLFARVVQHEKDHLNGVLFIDRIGRLKMQLLKKQLKEIEALQSA